MPLQSLVAGTIAKGLDEWRQDNRGGLGNINANA